LNVHSARPGSAIVRDYMGIALLVLSHYYMIGQIAFVSGKECSTQAFSSEHTLYFVGLNWSSAWWIMLHF